MKNKSTDYWDGDIFFYGPVMQKINHLAKNKILKKGRKHQATMLYCVNIKLLDI